MHLPAVVNLDPITTELTAALKQTLPHTAPGPDTLAAETWQWLDEHNLDSAESPASPSSHPPSWMIGTTPSWLQTSFSTQHQARFQKHSRSNRRQAQPFPVRL